MTFWEFFRITASALGILLVYSLMAFIVNMTVDSEHRFLVGVFWGAFLAGLYFWK